MTQNVIVILGGSCEEAPDDNGCPCVMGVVSWDRPREEAREFFRELKAQGYRPHWQSLRDPSDWTRTY